MYTRRKVKNFNKQMYAVQNLELPPSYGDYVVTKYEVTEIEGTNSVMVTREYKAPEWKITACHDCYIIGPRGAFKKVYDSMF